MERQGSRRVREAVRVYEDGPPPPPQPREMYLFVVHAWAVEQLGGLGSFISLLFCCMIPGFWCKKDRANTAKRHHSWCLASVGTKCSSHPNGANSWGHFDFSDATCMSGRSSMCARAQVRACARARASE